MKKYCNASRQWINDFKTGCLRWFCHERQKIIDKTVKKVIGSCKSEDVTEAERKCDVGKGLDCEKMA